MTEENVPNPNAEIIIPNEQTTQEDIPTLDAPRETFLTNSRFGLLSFAVFIVWLIYFFLASRNVLIFSPFIVWLLIPIIETILALIGLFNDGKKRSLLWL